MYSWWWVRLSPETCRVKPLRRIKTQLLHLVGLISLILSSVVSRIPDVSDWPAFYVSFYTNCTKLIHFSKSCNFKHHIIQHLFRRPFPVAARLLGLWVWIPLGTWLFVSCASCVLAGREVSPSGWSPVQTIPTECGVSQRDREPSIMKRRRPTRDCCATKIKCLRKAKICTAWWSTWHPVCEWYRWVPIKLRTGVNNHALVNTCRLTIITPSVWSSLRCGCGFLSTNRVIVTPARARATDLSTAPYGYTDSSWLKLTSTDDTYSWYPRFRWQY